MGPPPQAARRAHARPPSNGFPSRAKRERTQPVWRMLNKEADKLLHQFPTFKLQWIPRAENAAADAAARHAIGQ